MLDSTSPPPPPPLKTPASPPVPSTAATAAEETVSSTSSLSYNPSLLIITAIIIFVMLASFSIHLLLRIFSRRRPLPLVHPRASLSSFSSSGPAAAAVDLVSNEKEKKDREAAIESLPVFTLASALAAAPKSAADCAVCLSRFQPHDELRLLPACCHAFHQSCVDAWLRSTPSCPLCRASIYLPPAPPPPPQPLPAAPVNSSIATTEAEHQEAARSGSFRIEIGSVSRRRSNTTAVDGEAEPPPADPAHGRSYSLGSAYEYLVEEEVEAVVARALRRPVVSKEQKQEDHDSQPQPPGSEVAEIAGESSRGGSWLRDYVDRLASSASSSFSSLRFSSRRFESSNAAEELWDIEENHHRATAADAEDVGSSSAFYKWFMGVYS